MGPAEGVEAAWARKSPSRLPPVATIETAEPAGWPMGGSRPGCWHRVAEGSIQGERASVRAGPLCGAMGTMAAFDVLPRAPGVGTTAAMDGQRGWPAGGEWR
eukprot:scaffold1691_cov378-Prasinococcus_capsulatus_cf.AAC.8